MDDNVRLRSTSPTSVTSTLVFRLTDFLVFLVVFIAQKHAVFVCLRLPQTYRICTGVKGHAEHSSCRIVNRHGWRHFPTLPNFYTFIRKKLFPLFVTGTEESVDDDSMSEFVWIPEGTCHNDEYTEFR